MCGLTFAELGQDMMRGLELVRPEDVEGEVIDAAGSAERDVTDIPGEAVEKDGEGSLGSDEGETGAI